MNRTPFVIFALPRSRTAWVAEFLSDGLPCGHDTAVETDTLADFAAALQTRLCGTVETGSVVAWRALRILLPTAKIAVIRRPINDVYASLEQFGFGSTALRTMLEQRDALLDEVSRQPGVFSVNFSDLSRFTACQRLYWHCLDRPLDWERWEGLANKNIQIDVHAAISRQAERRPAIECLKAEAASLVAGHLQIGPERWDDMWPEADALGAEHFQEVDGGIEPKRPFRMDDGLMRVLTAAGNVMLYGARLGGALVGYCTWNIMPDIESKGLLIATQGAWFVKRGLEKLDIGRRLFDESLDELRRRGVQCAFPHHRTQGRGANLGAFFRRRGAKEIQTTYCLWIGG